MLVLIALKYENKLVLITPKGGKWCYYLLCQRRNHLQVFSTSCWPQLAKMSPTFAFTWLRFTWGILLHQALGVEEAFSEIFKLFCPFTCIPASRHSLNHWMNLSSPEKEKRVRVALSACSSSGQLCQWGLLWLLVEAIGHTLPRVQAFLRPAAGSVREMHKQNTSGALSFGTMGL